MFVCFFYFGHSTRLFGISFPQLRTEPGPSAVKAPSRNHRTTRDFPGVEFIRKGQAGIPTQSQKGLAEMELSPGSHAGGLLCRPLRLTAAVSLSHTGAGGPDPGDTQ